MRKLAVCLCLLFFVPALSGRARAQEHPSAPETAKAPATPGHFYHLSFVLEELDASGKPVNSRSFATMVGTAGSRSSITTGSKIPILTGTPHSAAGDKLGPEFQYIDVGVKITTRDVHEDKGRLSFALTAEVSSLAAPEMIAGVSEPVFRQNVWEGTVLLPIGEPTVAFKSDDLDNKGTMQLVVTVTPAE